MGSIYSPKEIVYHSLNFFFFFYIFPVKPCEPGAVLAGIFLKLESIYLMFIGQFKLPEYVSFSYIS